MLIMISVFIGCMVTGITPEQKNTERRKPGTNVDNEYMPRSILTWFHGGVCDHRIDICKMNSYC